MSSGLCIPRNGLSRATVAQLVEQLIRNQVANASIHSIQDTVTKHHNSIYFLAVRSSHSPKNYPSFRLGDSVRTAKTVVKAHGVALIDNEPSGGESRPPARGWKSRPECLQQPTAKDASKRGETASVLKILSNIIVSPLPKDPCAFTRMGVFEINRHQNIRR